MDPDRPARPSQLLDAGDGAELPTGVLDWVLAELDAGTPADTPKKGKKAADPKPADGPPAAPTDGPAGTLTPADLAVIRKGERSTNGGKFRRLMAGDVAGYPSASEAHLGLLSLLVFHADGGPEQVERIFGTTPHAQHPKWGRDSYRERSIKRAFRKLTAQQPAGGECSDVANAGRLIEWFGDRLRFMIDRKVWVWFTGERWVAGELAVLEAAKQTATRLVDEAGRRFSAASNASNPAELARAQDYCKWAATTKKNTRRIKDMVVLAAADPRVHAVTADFDRDEWSLSCPSGTIDLRTGRQTAHRAEDMVSAGWCPTVYRPDAACPTWETFFATVLGGDPELIRWFRRWLGVCLSADTSVQLLPVCWGAGSNGKSTLLDTLFEVVGGTWGKAVAELLLSTHGEPHPTQAANLLGMRLAVATESDENRKLHEARVKELTGDSTIKARFMRQDFFEFRRTHKLMLVTNHKPRVSGQDHGLWRRLALIPFQVRFWDSDDPGQSGPDRLRIDRDMKRKLLAEREGIFAWLVRAAVEVHSAGVSLGPCRAIAAATSSYQQAEDVVAAFLAEAADTADRSAEEPAPDVFAAFTRWANANCVTQQSRRWLTERLAEKGIGTRPSSGRTLYVGIRLRA